MSKYWEKWEDQVFQAATGVKCNLPEMEKIPTSPTFDTFSGPTFDRLYHIALAELAFAMGYKMFSWIWIKCDDSSSLSITWVIIVTIELFLDCTFVNVKFYFKWVPVKVSFNLLLL